MDSLGQGVSKETDKITFISKTLPGDEGKAKVLSEKKGVSFAEVSELHQSSSLRVKPDCPHFSQCPSCHYLHTTYDQELEFKRLSFERLLHKIPHPSICVTPALRRTHYRNRVQLHYDKDKKLLGMLNAKNHTIAPIPECLIGRELVSKEIKNLYQNQLWLELAIKEPSRGHVEIYEKNGEISVAWNKSYAEGGFTQVFEEMNQVLKNILNIWLHSAPITGLLDLFAGNGNLSNNANYSQRLCVDYYPGKVDLPFFSQDIYAADALKKIQRLLLQNNLQPHTLILDPPRSGLKNLEQWLELFSPQRIAYVSCDPHTLVRDIKPLKNYELTQVHLVDFFPSTFHFESMVFLERN